MPNLREHLKISELLLGYSNPLVHRILDYQGRNLEHRFRHTPKTALFIKEAFGDDEYVEAWLHIFSDWGIFRMPGKGSSDSTVKKKRGLGVESRRKDKLDEKGPGSNQTEIWPVDRGG